MKSPYYQTMSQLKTLGLEEIEHFIPNHRVYKDWLSHRYPRKIKSKRVELEKRKKSKNRFYHELLELQYVKSYIPRSQIRQECQQLTRYWNKHGMNKNLPDLKIYDDDFNNYTKNTKAYIIELT